MTSDTTRQPDAQSPDRRRRRWRPLVRCVAFCLCICLGILVGNSLMPNPDTDRVNLRNVSEDGQFNRIRRFLHGDPTQRAAEIGKNHELVRAAFRDVVRPAVSSTVQVRIEGRQVALGMVVDRLGHILTKASEIDGPVRIKVAGGGTVKAEIVGIDRELDLALLRTSRTDLTPVTFASQMPPLGSWLAVTHHRGEDPLLVGVISSLAREIPQDQGFLGVLLGQTPRGSRIDHVLQESSAERSGLLSGDIIYAVDGQRISDRATLIQTVQQFQPGAHVEFEILRDGKRITRQITLTREGEVAAAEDGSQQHDGGPLSNRRSGFSQVLQHDCPLRPNQCGGPLVDLDGRVVGVNIARAGRVESYAIPSHLVQASLARLKASSN